MEIAVEKTKRIDLCAGDNAPKPVGTLPCRRCAGSGREVVAALTAHVSS
jgi:hypothetical protein